MSDLNKPFDLAGPCKQSRRLKIALLVLLAIFLFGRAADAQYGGGSGTAEDPYQIATAEDLILLGESPEDYGKHFILTDDIDLGPNLPGGRGFDRAVIAPPDIYSGTVFHGISFTGTFDGNGFIVRNLTIRGEGYLGLFGEINGGAEVRDLGVVDGHVVGTRKRIGILVGENYGTLINCYSSGFVSSDDYGAGGLVGYNLGLVTRCYSTAEVHSHHYAGGLIGGNVRDVTSCFSTGTVSGSFDVGGLSGYNYGRINGCYCTGSVTGTTNVGGLVGWNNSGMIQNSYSTGTVRGNRSVWGSGANFGGLVGNNDNGSIGYCYSVGKVYGKNYVGGLVGRSDGSVSYCFWDTEITSQWTSAGGIGKTTAEMQRARTFVGWEWDTVWTIDEGKDYPRLFWENLPGEPITKFSYGGGSGTKNDPYLIYTAGQMNAIGLYKEDWDMSFKLMADIDLSAYTGTDFNIIGYYTRSAYDYSKPFTGVFNGNGHTISNFTYTSTDTDEIGLFRYVGGGTAEIKDLRLINPNIHAGAHVGSLVGYLGDGTITGCYVEGGSVSGDEYVGGLVGKNSNTITNCHSTGSIEGSANIGGVVGVNQGDVTHCYSTGTVSGGSSVGGLVGVNEGGVTGCYSTGAVSGNERVGGMVGWSRGTITKSYSRGTVSGTGNIGGLVGRGDRDRVRYSFWDMETSGQSGSDGGIGLTTAEMMDPEILGLNGFDGDPNWVLDNGRDYPRLVWEGTPGQMIPEPVIDWLDGSGTSEDPFQIENADQLLLIHKSSLLWDKHFVLNADIDMDPNLPGRGVFEQAVIPTFWGSFDGNGHVIINLQTECGDHLGLFGVLTEGSVVRDLGLENVSVHGTGSNVGGLIGHNSGHVLNCYSTGEVGGHSDVGGLVGRNNGDVTQCYTTGTVSGIKVLGGLVAVNSPPGTITGCYSTGAVSGTEGCVGGLVGQNSRSVANCYSTGEVSGDWPVGGLVAFNYGFVSDCYSTGEVSGNVQVGGLVGSRGDPAWSDVITSFWDMQTSGQTTSVGGTGKTTAQMQTASTFLNAGWDFVDETENGTEDIWAILEGHDYPRLAWELRAFSPHPQNRATNVTQAPVLSWSGMRRAIGHDVYFGEDRDLVANATTESPDIYRGRQPPEMTTYDPGDLEWYKTYYWRIDEVDEADPNSPWKGNVWSFTVAEFFILIDDFEDYNDYEPDRIFDTWIDGWGISTNGAEVGYRYWPGPKNFKMIVHGGSQSMPYFYNNTGTANYSEATASIANLAIGQDWTQDGVGVLSLWFYGDADNAAERMYVNLNGIATVYHDNPDAALIDEWTEWRIDLQEFAAQGVNLANVNTISIGFGDKNNLRTDGSGLVFFDDIRLYHHQVIYVDDDATGANSGSSWANAYVYLQDALADANESQRPVEIHVAQGTYTPDRGNGYARGDKQAKFLLKSGVTIKGGFAGVSASDPNAWDHQVYKTVLSGDLSGNDERLLSNFVENSDHVIWCIEGDASAVLDGFTITGGYATDRIGGGLLNYKANPIVKRCVFFDNYASQGGGMANRYSSPTLTDCTFSGNLAPYGGGGMYNTDQSHPMVESCVFYDNWTTYLGGGGMYCGESNPVVIHCLFIDNVAPFGGGMYNAAANPFIGNCTFSNNRSNSWGGGMQNEAGANPMVTNSIFWGNIPDGITTFGGFGTVANVTYSDVQGGHLGKGNMNTDPLFANPNGDDYHLKSQAGRWDPVGESWVQDDVTSPCIDAGDPNSDWTNEIWPHGERINMGAYGGTRQSSMSTRPESLSLPDVVYIYLYDDQAAESFRSFLVGYGCSTTLIGLDQVTATPLDSYDLIIVGDDTGYLSNWGDDQSVAAIETLGKPVVGLGEGGYAFFGKLGLSIGWPYGWHGDNNSIYVIDPNYSLFSTPYAIDIPDDRVLQLYTQTNHVGIYLYPMPETVITLGRETESPSHYPLVLENRYLLWGFTESPEYMTEFVKRLFINVVIWTANTSWEIEN